MTSFQAIAIIGSSITIVLAGLMMSFPIAEQMGHGKPRPIPALLAINK